MLHDLAPTVASRTGLFAVLVLSTCAITMGTRHIFVDFQFLLCNSGHLFQGHFNLDSDVGATAHALGRSTATAAEKVANVEPAAKTATKTTAEDVGEVTEDVVDVGTGEIGGSPAHAGMTELVVACLFVRIAQHIVRLCRLLELFLRLLVARVAVGMVLHGLLAVGLFYLVCRGLFRDPKHFIIVSFFCHNVSFLLLTHHHFGIADHFV